MKAMCCRLMLVSAALLGLAGCQRILPSHARVDAAIAPLIPGDTVVLAGLRLDRLKGTPFFEKYVGTRRLPALASFREMTGIDPVNDVWELVYAATAKRRLVFIRGKFGGEFGLEPNFAAPGLQRMNYKGYYILYKGDGGVLFLNSGVAVAGLIPDLRALVDNRDKSSETPPLALLEMVKTLPADHVWVVAQQAGALAAGLPDEGNAGNFARLAKALGRVTLHGEVGKTIQVEAEGDYPTAEMAKQVQDTVRAAIAMMRVRTPDSQAAMLKVYDGIRVEARESRIEVKVDAPLDFLDAVLKDVPAAKR